MLRDRMAIWHVHKLICKITLRFRYLKVHIDVCNDRRYTVLREEHLKRIREREIMKYMNYGLSDRSLHICTLPVYELISKKSIRLRYIKLHIDRFVMIIRTLS